MIELLAVRQVLVIVFLAIASYTDVRERLIFDRLTYPAIAIGVALNLVEMNFVGLALGALVFVVGFAVYYMGKIGGGDVKMYTALALLLPFFGGEPFVASVIFVAALTSTAFLAVYYVVRYLHRGIDVGYNKDNIKKALGLAIVFFVYFAVMLYGGALRPFTAAVVGIPLAGGLVFLALEKGIRKEFFLKRVNVMKLDDDEVVALDFLDEKTKQVLGLTVKGVLGKKELQKLEQAGITSVVVYRALPPFAPFTLAGAAISFLFPGVLQALLGL